MSESTLNMTSKDGPAFPPIVAGNIILNGENPFIRLFKRNGEMTTDASLWTVTFSPRGGGHALFIRSELTNDKWRIYSDNVELVRWLQNSVQGMLNPETSNENIPVIEAIFSRAGNTQVRWEQKVQSQNDTIVLSWEDFLPPLLMAHDQPTHLPDRKYGVNLVMIPSRQAKLTINNKVASGETLPCTYDGQLFSTSSLAFSESWRE